MEQNQMQFAALIEEAIRAGRGVLNPHGALMVDTGKWTGRAVEARRIVDRPEIRADVAWGKVNKPIAPAESDTVFAAIAQRLQHVKSYQMKGFVGPFPVEVHSTSPWHIAFAQALFRATRIDAFKGWDKQEPIRIYHEPYLTTSELGCECEQETLVALDLQKRRVVIAGTAYAGEIKKSAFSMANFLLPKLGILSMHASANVREDGSETCVLFGLSGTGKTTLSADADRALIGDDEILWSSTGISNLEGGCYAKLIHLTEDREPEIFRAVNRFGAILENVVYDRGTREVNFDSSMRTENTRGAYPISHIEHIHPQGIEAPFPRTIVFLTADAFGALPAVAKLDPWQAQYHFVSGYTAKVAGTELGVKEPTATFSQCFGAPFMPRAASTYAAMLAEKAAAAGAEFWMLNTGWFGGGYGRGTRFPLPVTRALLRAIQSGKLSSAPAVTHPVFGFQVPISCPDVEGKWLVMPSGPEVRALAEKFDANAEALGAEISTEVRRKGGPRLSAEATTKPMVVATR